MGLSPMRCGAVLSHESTVCPSEERSQIMTTHALNGQELTLLREEIEMLMVERQRLLHVAGAAAVLVANLDTKTLPHEQDTIDAAEVLAESLNALPDETLQDALDSVSAELDPEAQAAAETGARSTAAD
jgi:hypothetical protein